MRDSRGGKSFDSSLPGAERATGGGRLEPADEAGGEAVLAPLPSSASAETDRPGRPHFVVVRTRPVRPADSAPAGAELVTCFWHPRNQRWSENYFESLEHALRLFLDESGWALIQQQALDGPHAHELIFEARRADFTGPVSDAEVLEQVGLRPGEVADLLERVERKRDGST